MKKYRKTQAPVPVCGYCVSTRFMLECGCLLPKVVFVELRPPALSQTVRMRQANIAEHAAISLSVMSPSSFRTNRFSQYFLRCPRDKKTKNRRTSVKIDWQCDAASNKRAFSAGGPDEPEDITCTNTVQKTCQTY